MKFFLLVVLHETLITAQECILLHGDADYYASYHALIHRSGLITYLTPSDCKAYAASNSRFINNLGEEEHIQDSVDDFAYHIALETPPDGLTRPLQEYHIGYTKEQYKSLAWLCRATGVLLSRIVDHSDISLNKPTLREPRCFNDAYFSLEYENTFNLKSIDFGILDY